MVVVAAGELFAQENKESSVARPNEGKFGGTLLRIATFYYIYHYDHGNQLSMNHYGFVDLKGKIVIEPQWDDALAFKNGLAAVKRNDKWGCIDKTGKVAIPLEFDGIDADFPGLIAVRQNKKWGFIDRTGQMIVSPQWDTCTPYRESDDRNAAVYWLVAREEPKPPSPFVTIGPAHILVKWLDSAGKEIWSFEQSKPSG
jgi:hypothetical protein